MKSCFCRAISWFGVVFATGTLGCSPEVNIGTLPMGSESSSGSSGTSSSSSTSSGTSSSSGGTSSSSGGQCEAVRTLASGLTYPAAMARQDDYLYVLTALNPSLIPLGTGMLYKVPVAGGEPIVLAAGLGWPQVITTDATNVYWTDYDGTVRRMPLDGGQPTVIAAGQSPWGIAVDATYVYWATGATVMKAPLAGGPPSVVFSPGGDVAGILGIAVDSTNLYCSAVTGAGLNGDGVLFKAPLDGGSPMKYATGVTDCRPVAVDASSIYWTNLVTYDAQMKQSPGKVMRMPIDGSGSPVEVGTQLVPEALALDATGIYASGGLMDHTDALNAPIVDPSAVSYFPLAGGAPKTLASAVSWGLATCPGGVCWTDMANGTVMRYEACLP